MKRIVLALILLVSMVITSGVTAQDDGDELVLEPGVELEGEMDPDTLAADVYFDGVAGDVVRVRVEWSHAESDTDIDSITIFQPDGDELVRVTRGAFFVAEYNFPQYRLPQSGRYHIALTSNKPGPFKVWYTIRETPDLDENASVEEGFGGTNVGFLDYVFTAEAGETIRATVRSASFDAVLTLQDANGSVLAEDDDSLRDLNPMIGPITLPEAGEYRLVVTSYVPDDTGVFHITLQRNPTPDERMITYGQPVTVTFDEDQRVQQQFWFDGANGDVVELVSDDPDAIAEVRIERQTDYGRIMVSTDDTQPHLYDQWQRFVLLDTGRHNLFITPRDESVTGTVQVQVNRLGENSLDGPYEVPRTIRVHVSQKDPVRHFTLYGTSTAQATITIAQANYDADTMPFRVTLRTQNGSVLARMVVEDMAGSFGLSQQIVAQLVMGEITLELEMLGTGPAWFEIRLELAYGMG